MVTETNAPPASPSSWKGTQVLAMALVCLVFGLAIGYLFRGSQPAPPSKTQPSAGMQGRMPTLDEMKHMADKKAAPLLEKLKADPANKDLLFQVGNTYKAAHQFKDAAGYYEKSLQADPKNTAVRTEMASCLYYSGDTDGALAQLQKALEYDPKDANSLFNLGLIRLRGKQDTKGALAAWEQLLKSNPQLPAERKAQVQKLMADAKAQNKS
jgi:cytochrome c-type biogenesis protein CcmH/NrfG